MAECPIIHIDDVSLVEHGHGEAFAARLGAMAAPLGAGKLGCRLTVVPPGKAAWPYHAHHANDELFVVLSGTGTLRYGGEDFPLKPGDIAVCPAGGRETAHQIRNTGEEDLKYLAVSSMAEPDVMEYPDSGKFGVLSGAAPGGDKAKRRLAFFGRTAGGVDYWDGEG